MTENAANTDDPMGASPHSGGVAFRVWAPNAEKVSVVGSFNDWNAQSDPMTRDDKGCWRADLSHAKVGDEYRYQITNGEQVLSRMDPYAREVTHSAGNGIVHDPQFDWGDEKYPMPPWNALVVYEMHAGTFGGHEPKELPGALDEAIHHLSHLERLGVNAIQIMPVAEFAGDISWGYNPAYIFAVESAYGGPKALKRLVKEAHARGFAVILDVVYNHFGPGDLGLWQFDGWNENGQGGIYFYNDWRNETPWGATRPDYGRAEVRRYIRDNVMMWLEEYHIDGLRWDATLQIRTVHARDNDPGNDLPDGWSLMQEINKEIFSRFPGRLTIAEDLRNNEWLTRSADAGSAGFGAQWDAGFVHPIRAAATSPDDAARGMSSVRDALLHAYNGEAFQRVIYSESHDEVANGKARVPHEINPGDPDDWFAQKRSTLAAALVFTAPGIPMLFQGQEFLQGLWFRDDVPLDWHQSKEFSGIVRLYRDLIRLRLDRARTTRGLCGRGVNVFHVNEDQKVIAMHRWDQGGPLDDVVVVANFANRAYEKYVLGLPREGTWKVRLNSDWQGYSKDFGNFASNDVLAEKADQDGHPSRGSVAIAPYSVVILSQDP